ncbi:MAG: hypothetical protein ACLFV3_03985 [Phycisphaeraceae bacterium]
MDRFPRLLIAVFGRSEPLREPGRPAGAAADQPTAAPPSRPADRSDATDWTDDEGRLNFDLPCRACGYNLRTLSVAATCPECGEKVLASAVSFAARPRSEAFRVRITAQDRVVHALPVPCMGCGEDVRGLRLDATCLDCGTPVIETWEHHERLGR